MVTIYLLSTFSADCLRHPMQMVGLETIWELHTLIYCNKLLCFMECMNNQ